MIAINLTRPLSTPCAPQFPGIRQEWGRIISTASGAFAGRLAIQSRLCHRQARPRGSHQDSSAGGCDLRPSPVNCIRRVCLDAAVAKQIPDTLKARNMTRSRSRTTCCSRRSRPTVRTVEQVAAAAILTHVGRSPLDHGANLSHRRRLDRAVMKHPLACIGRPEIRRRRQEAHHLALQGRWRARCVHLGVLDELLADKRIEIEGMSGTSAGAITP